MVVASLPLTFEGANINKGERVNLRRKPMALDPLELLSIAAIIVVFFLWGPQKIPELARAIGQARKEFDNASKEFQKISTNLQNGTSPLLGTTPAPSARARPSDLANKTGDELLIDAARRLGIHTQGKTREQIEEEIVEVAHGSSAAKSDAAAPATKDATTTPA